MPRLFVAFGFAFVVVAFATRTTDFEPFLLGGIFVLGALAWVWWERRIATEVRLDDDRVTFVGKHQHVVARRRDIVALEAPVWDFNRVSYITVRFAGPEQPIRVARLRHLVELVLELRRRNPDLLRRICSARRSYCCGSRQRSSRTCWNRSAEAGGGVADSEVAGAATRSVEGCPRLVP
jgi:hypothetical protein